MKNRILFNDCLLRYWKSTDKAEYVRLIQDPFVLEHLRPETPFTEEEFDSLIYVTNSDTRLYHYAIEVKEQLVGGISYEEKTDKYIEFRNFWIASQFRKSGIGLQANFALENHIRNNYQGYKICLQTINNNQNAINIAQKLGYICNDKIKDETKDCNGNTVKLLFFEKELTL